MLIFTDNRLNMTALAQALEKPEPYTKSSHRFWDDPYVSSRMLEYHLDPDTDAASRKPAVIRAEAGYIMNYVDLKVGMRALDLGCGPGLYVREFAGSGACITGMDLSANSIEYAREHVQTSNTDFCQGNYVQASLGSGYDLITLIYFDFCALNPKEQQQMLGNVHHALADDGCFVMDILTEYTRTQVGEKVTVYPQGLWSPKPYLEIYQAFLYPEPRTEGFQYTILEETGELRSMRIFHRLFSLAEIRALLSDCGFVIESIYKDLSGNPWSEGAETMALFCRKK